MVVRHRLGIGGTVSRRRGKNKNPIKRSPFRGHESHVGVTRFGSCHQRVLPRSNGFFFGGTEYRTENHPSTIAVVIIGTRLFPLPDARVDECHFHPENRPVIITISRTLLPLAFLPCLIVSSASPFPRFTFDKYVRRKAFYALCRATFQRLPGRRTQGWFANFPPPPQTEPRQQRVVPITVTRAPKPDAIKDREQSQNR